MAIETRPVLSRESVIEAELQHPGGLPKLRDVSRKLEIACLVVALAVHVPVLSLGAFAWLARLFDATAETSEVGEVEVPLDLDLDDEDATLKKGDGELPKDNPIAVVDDSPVENAVADAGPPVDAGIVDGGPDGSVVDAAPPDAMPPDAPQPVVDDTKAPPNPSGNPNNVVVELVGKRLREHPVGLKLGQMLPTIRQWKEFFDNTGIDAVSDVDVMVIMGPQLVQDSSQVDVMMIINKPTAEVHDAVGTIIGRNKPKGAWLDGMPIPAAEGSAAGAARLFVMVPKQNELYITPPPKPKKGESDWSDEEKTKRYKEKIQKIERLKAPNADVAFAVHLSVREPGKLSKFDAGVVEIHLIPSSFDRAELFAYPLASGGARVRLELLDDTAENAKKDLSDIQGNYDMLVTLGSSAVGLDLPALKFEAKEKKVVAETEVSREFLDQIVAKGEAAIAEGNKPRKKK